MIVLAGRVTTPVPNRPYIFTGVPVSRVATVLPARPHVKARLPEAPRAGSKLPVAPHYRTRRPPTKNRLVAGNTTTVSGSAVVHARLGVEFAEQSVQVDQAGKLAVGLGAVSAVGVSGSAVVRGLYRVEASNAVGVAGSGVARVRHTLDASQAIATTTDGGDARALYSLTAAQNISVDQPVESRPFIDVAASQDVGVVSAASSVPSVGTVNADATQDIGVDSAAIVRVRHSVAATQSIVSGQSTVLDGLRVPLAASQGVAVVGSGDARALYTIPASQTVVASSAGMPSPSLSAAGTVGVDSAGTSRARHTLQATGSTSTESSATAEVRTVAFDQVQSTTATNANASITMTTPATTLIIAASNNIITGMTVTVDGNAATLHGTQGNMRLYSAQVSAGSHTIVGAASGAWRTLIVASYTGVTAVTGYAGASGTSATPSIAPSGSGILAVSAFVGNNVSAAGTTSNGDLRAKQAAASAAYNLALADRTSAPVTLTQTSAAWSAVGVWLN